MAAASTFAAMAFAAGDRRALPRRRQSGDEPSDHRSDPARRRGWVTGIKQSGETTAIVLSAGALPAAAVLWGWREALRRAGRRGGRGAARRRAHDPAAPAVSDGRRRRPAPGERGVDSPAQRLQHGHGGGHRRDHRVPAPLRARGRSAERRRSRLGDGRRGLCRGRRAARRRAAGARRTGDTRTRWQARHGGALACGLLAGRTAPRAARRSGSSAALWGVGGLGFGAVSMLAVMAEADEAKTGHGVRDGRVLVQPRLQRRSAPVRVVGRTDRTPTSRRSADRRPLRGSRRSLMIFSRATFRPVAASTEGVAGSRRARIRARLRDAYTFSDTTILSAYFSERTDQRCCDQEGQIDRRDTVAGRGPLLHQPVEPPGGVPRGTRVPVAGQVPRHHPA